MEYEVILKPSGKQFVVADDCSVLDGAAQAKINLPHSCRNGSCGACKSRLLKGQIDQPVSLDGITADELTAGYILTCLAKPKTNLEIESAYYPELDGIEPVLLPCKVETIDFSDSDIAILHLRLPSNTNIRYLPGQYINLTWKGVTRSYSIANAGQQDHRLELHIRHVDGGEFSKFVFEEIKAGTLLRLEGPHGTFFVRNSDAPIIFLAGGTGFAPVKAMVEQLLEQDTKRLIYIYWGIRSIAAFYTTLPEQWQKTYNNIMFVPVLSGNEVEWQGRRGLVHQAVMEDFSELAPFEIYACGSMEMITAAKSDFLDRGLTEKNFFSDAFTPYKQIN